MKILITDKNGQILYEGSPSLHGDGVVIGSGNDCDIQLNKMGGFPPSDSASLQF